ncbi:hypothetical protein HDV57DRAFT_290645 [Trichoderma longibrachiatum]
MLLLVIMTDMKRKSRPRKRDTMPLGHLARRGRPCGVASTSFCGYTAVQRLQDATKRSLWMLMPCSACVTTYYLNMLLDSWPRVDIEAQHCWDGIWLQVWPEMDRMSETKAPALCAISLLINTYLILLRSKPRAARCITSSRKSPMLFSSRRAGVLGHCGGQRRKTLGQPWLPISIGLITWNEHQRPHLPLYQVA